ncbi:MAG: hypothetical protein MJ252_03830 [archaeon]|nr:hypothetical protein [archaeon]
MSFDNDPFGEDGVNFGGNDNRFDNQGGNNFDDPFGNNGFEENKEFTVNIKNVNGATTSYTVTPSTTIQELAQKYIEKESLSQDSKVILSYQGKILKETETVGENNITEGTTIHSLIRLGPSVIQDTQEQNPEPAKRINRPAQDYPNWESNVGGDNPFGDDNAAIDNGEFTVNIKNDQGNVFTYIVNDNMTIEQLLKKYKEEINFDNKASLLLTFKGKVLKGSDKIGTYGIESDDVLQTLVRVHGGEF